MVHREVMWVFPCNYLLQNSKKLSLQNSVIQRLSVALQPIQFFAQPFYLLNWFLYQRHLVLKNLISNRIISNDLLRLVQIFAIRINFLQIMHSRGDSNIVYIDGVAPPTSPSSNATSSNSNSSSPTNANEEYVIDNKNESSYMDWISWKNLNKTPVVKDKQTSSSPPTSTPTSSTSSLVGFGGKLNTNHHLKLLQTIREQDEGESR